MKTLDRIGTFLVKVVPRVQDEERRNALRISLSQWMRYCTFLRIILDRHDRVVADYRAIDERSNEFFKDFVGTQRPATQQETEDLVRQQELMPYLHLEIESFYVFAKVLLDRIADTFAHYAQVSLKHAGSTHVQLLTEATRGTLRGALPDTLVAQLRTLRDRVTGYRSDFIDHPSEQRLSRATVTDGGGIPRISPMVHWPRSDEEVERLQRVTDNPHDLLGLIDEYVAAMLTFLEQRIGGAEA